MWCELVPAEIMIIPRTINLASKGRWIAAFLWLPEDYKVADIDPNSVVLQSEIEPEQFWVNEQEHIALTKFSREEVQAFLNISEVELTISGELFNGTVFEGTDVIRVIHKGKGIPDKYVQASEPNPPDGATDVSLIVDLSWSAGFGVTSHNVYFGTSSPPPFIHNQTSTTFHTGIIGMMSYETTYYWRIDEVNSSGTTTGTVWSFTTLMSPLPPPPP